MNKAVVLNVQRFSVHDGPGIRTTVFLKGCPLRCLWCHNPESMEARPELALKEERCLACGFCAASCPEGVAGNLGPDSGASRPGEICHRCGACAEACPTRARELLGQLMGVEELVAELNRDRHFFEESGGGVTFSGGEPASRGNAPFLLDCLTACAGLGLHRTVDTCGHVPAEILREVADLADLILFDLKIMDPELHRKATGLDNELILSNLRELVTAGTDLRIRVPLIPGFTDGPENLLAIAREVADFGRKITVHLLPHHGSAGEKYRRLGLNSVMAGVDTPNEDQVSEKVELFRSLGINVIVGG